MNHRIREQRSVVRTICALGMLIVSAILLSGCSTIRPGLHPPTWIHGTWVMVVEAGGQIIEIDAGFEFTATTAHMFAPQMRLDLSELYRRAAIKDEAITDTLYSFTIKTQAGAFGHAEGDYVTYEFRRVTTTRVDFTMRTPLLELGPSRLHRR